MKRLNKKQRVANKRHFIAQLLTTKKNRTTDDNDFIKRYLR